jgi:sulfur-oxidizing protein SoxZ
MSSIKIRSKRLKGKTEIRTLITHPMEYGLSHDAKTNEIIPAHFIHTLTVAHNKKIVATCHLGMNMSKDPFFIFMLNSGASGDIISINWEDNLGNTDTEQHVIM